jgi:hypothetical protein
MGGHGPPRTTTLFAQRQLGESDERNNERCLGRPVAENFNCQGG